MEEEVNLENEWDELAPQLSIVVEGSLETTTDVIPFDATSDVPIDEQKYVIYFICLLVVVHTFFASGVQMLRG